MSSAIFNFDDNISSDSDIIPKEIESRKTVPKNLRQINLKNLLELKPNKTKTTNERGGSCVTRQTDSYLSFLSFRSPTTPNGLKGFVMNQYV